MCKQKQNNKKYSYGQDVRGGDAGPVATLYICHNQNIFIKINTQTYNVKASSDVGASP